MHPRAFPAFAGRTFVFSVGPNHPWPWLATQGVTRGQLAAWGSVLVSALDLAIRVGASPIVIVGADLAYTGGQPYCRGTAFEEDWAREMRDGERLADVWARVANRAGAHGLRTSTARRCRRCRISSPSATTCSIASPSGVRIVNATGGGILHGRGLEMATLDDVLASVSSIGDLRARLRRAPRALRGRSDAAVIDAALAGRDTVDALTALVPEVDVIRMASAVAHARSTMTAPPTRPPIAVEPRTTARTVWLPEQTAALAALAVPGAADRAPRLDPAATVTWESVVDAGRDLLAHDPVVAGPVDADLLTADSLALPLQSLLPLAPGARPAGEGFGAALTRWIATHPSDPAIADPSFWSTPLASIDPPADTGAIARPADDLARVAVITTLAWVAARHDGAESVLACGGSHRAVVVTRDGRGSADRTCAAGAAGRGRRRRAVARRRCARPARPRDGRHDCPRERDPRPTRRRSRASVPRLTLSTTLEIDLGGTWTSVGESVVAASARLALPEPTVRCLSCSALPDGRAVVTRQDGTGSYVIDAGGHVTSAVAWPAPILGEGPLDAEGSWYARSARPARLLVRDTAGAITQDLALPFTPNAAEADAGGLRFAALDGVWRWTPARGVEQVVASPPLVATWPSAMAGLDPALAPPLEGPRPRTRRGLTWSQAQGLREHDVPPLGPIWSRSWYTRAGRPTRSRTWTLSGCPTRRVCADGS